MYGLWKLATRCEAKNLMSFGRITLQLAASVAAGLATSYPSFGYMAIAFAILSLAYSVDELSR